MKRFVFFTWFLFCFLVYGKASIIVPPQHLGILGQNSTAVAYGQLTKIHETLENNQLRTIYHFDILIPIKGNFVVGDSVELYSRNLQSHEYRLIIAGEPNFKLGKKYLLFLNQSNRNRWNLSLLSYGILEEINIQGASCLVPMDESANFQVLSDQFYYNPQIYLRDLFFEQLKFFINYGSGWNEEKVRPNFKIPNSKLNPRVAPAHCSFLSYQGTGFRWTDFPEQEMAIRYGAAGDPSFSGAKTASQNAIQNLSIHYTGTYLTDGGEHDYQPNCLGGSAAGGNFIDYILNTYGSTRNSLIIFDDPCDELADIVNCDGILALGGMYGLGAHSFDQKLWYSSALGFVIVNNDLGLCANSTFYKLILTHELTHVLGADHINSQHGLANLNPNCCNNITTLDIQCLEYLYPSTPAALHVLNFTGQKQVEGVHLKWSVVSANHEDIAIVERSHDGISFNQLQQNNLTNFSLNGRNDQFHLIDSVPLNGTNYYKLKILTDNNQVLQSPIIQIFYDQEFILKINYKGHVWSESFHFSDNKQNNKRYQFTLYTMFGLNVGQHDQMVFQNQMLHLNESMPSGVYILEMEAGNFKSAKKIILE
ncbi:MAG: hypothetical protein M3Q56_05345 [Bacteroidota bacterium]|nr:hypothetical protein [Bacteroidota bacterium]